MNRQMNKQMINLPGEAITKVCHLYSIRRSSQAGMKFQFHLITAIGFGYASKPLFSHSSHLLRQTNNNVPHTLFYCKRKCLALLATQQDFNKCDFSFTVRFIAHTSQLTLAISQMSSIIVLTQILEYWEMTENITGLDKNHRFYPEANMESKEFKV